MPHHIGTLHEHALHAALKQHYAKPNDHIEANLDGYCIDILRGAGKRAQLIEIQTRSFSSIKPKLAKLLPTYKITLVHPIAAEKWIVRYDSDGVLLSRKRSPKRGTVCHVFRELVFICNLATHKNLRLDVVLTHEEEVQRADGKGSWRRKGHSIYNRHLLGVVQTHSFKKPQDWLALLPAELPSKFTNAELARALKLPSTIASRMTYSLQHMGVLNKLGKRGRAHEFEVNTLN